MLVALISAAAAIMAAIGAIIADRRLHSGNIDTTEAKELWDEGRKMREDLRTEVKALRDEVATLKAEVIHLRGELAAASRVQSEMVALRVENQELRARLEGQK